MTAQFEYRTLNEIVAWYGVPVQVIWFLPKATFSEAGERTYLLFPERERYCETDGWVNEFRASEAFRCFLFSSERFDTIVVTSQ